MTTYNPFSRPFYVMTKPVGSACNLACDYCYYLEKSNLYADTSRHLMSESLLEKFVEDYIQSQTTPDVLFMWHGGEPLLRPISFYEKAVSLQKQYSQGRRIENTLQTNGLLLTDEWCEFFKKNNWLIGISIDGPQFLHDEYRVTKNEAPTFDKVMQGVNLLKKHGVEWNALSVVNDYNADYPMEYYDFMKKIGATYIQLIPIVESLYKHSDGRHIAAVEEGSMDTIADFSVSPQQWGNFICKIFDRWVRYDVGRFYIQLFDSTLANWMGLNPGVCVLAKTCGHAGVMEFNGDVYACDHFVFPQYKLGNFHTKSLLEMFNSPEQLKFGQDKYDTLPKQCKSCKYLFACYGECPKNRFAKSRDGEPGLNYLCEGYYRFFNHVAPYMDFMKNELENERPPANIMHAIKTGIIK